MLNEEIFGGKRAKHILRRIYNQGMPQPPMSLQDDLHILYDEDGEGWKEYGFFELEEDYTDKEIDELLWEEIGRQYCWTPYDCTGQAFTYWIHWHRCPNGMISVVHRVCLDV